ncbi:hypothetical protein CYMTET_23975 [Cymbomonas tetramitiformis]|uniref:Uncharacterized protein n=1 Tax=Cymbomonas tetramitiformis TaxID=36881 RepID=A0AAE0L0R5_9CHLO|nr:hypothetical protein CYMTET_23975 [Cymbomonas tetramitiformis]
MVEILRVIVLHKIRCYARVLNIQCFVFSVKASAWCYLSCDVSGAASCKDHDYQECSSPPCSDWDAEECKSGWTIDTEKYSSNYVYCVDTTTLHFKDGETNSKAKMSYSLGAYGSGGSMSFNAKYGGTGCCGLTMTFKDSGGNSIGEVKIKYSTLTLDSVDTGFKPDSNTYYSFSVIWSKSEVTSVLYGCNELLSKSISGVPASLEATSGYGSSTGYWMQFNDVTSSSIQSATTCSPTTSPTGNVTRML